MRFRRISERRGYLMGIATIMIAFFHLENGNGIGAFSYIRNFCDVGVDIFLIISGIGIFCSLSNNSNRDSNNMMYFKKRTCRVLIPYLVVFIPWWAYIDFIKHPARGVVSFLFDITMINYWYGRVLATWFVTGILVLYVAAPSICKTKNLERIALSISLLCYLAGCVVLFCPMKTLFGHLLIFIFRIPCFLLGLCVGKWVKIDKHMYFSFGRVIILIVVTLSAVVLCLMAMGRFPVAIPFALKYIFYLPIAFIIVCFFPGEPKCDIISTIGKYSFEVYLLQERVNTVLYGLFGTHLTFLFNLVSIGVVCIASVGLKKITSSISSRILS